MTNALARLLITAADGTRAAWDSATREAQNGSKKISGLVKGAFAGLAVGAAAKALKDLVAANLEYGEAVGDAAIKTGLTSEAISELGYAAGAANVEFDELVKSLAKMQVNVSKAGEGSKELLSVFSAIGVSFGKFQSLDPDRQFEVLAEAISRLPKEEDRVRAATELFGKAGAELLPLFSQGAEGIRQARERAQELGVTLSTIDQEKLQKAADSMDDLARASKGLGTGLTSLLAPGIAILADKANKFIGSFSDVNKEIDKLIAKREKLQQLLVDKKKEDGSFLDSFLGGSGADTVESLQAQLSEVEGKLTKARARFATTNPLKEPAASDLSSLGKAKGFSQLDLNNLTDAQGKALTREVLAFKQTDEQIAESRANRYARLRELDDLSTEIERSAADGTSSVFEENEKAIDESLSAIESKTLDTVEVQKSLFEEVFGSVEDQQKILEGSLEEFGHSIQSSLSDAFLDAGKGANKFADSVLNAFKRILADAAAQKTIQLIKSLFAGGKTGSSTSGSSAATSGIVRGIVGGLFGARASGGPVSGGGAYLVGEQGPEIFRPGQSGSIVPNNRLGGMSVAVDARVYVDARGATKDGADTLMKQLPSILDRRDRKLRDGIREDLNRGRFGLKG